MHDIQNDHDDRNTAIDRVGVCGLRYPIIVLDRQNDRQPTTASISMSVSLPHYFKGTHMSRFVEILNAHRGEITMRTVPSVLSELKSRLEAESAHVTITFPYFVERVAPVSGARGLMDYECTFDGESNGASADFVLTVRVPVSTVCPCSKQISEYGAHNQRGFLTISIRTRHTAVGLPDLVWIEELIDVGERSASAPVYALLKREDERHVTMLAYDNPVFVEDMVRSAACLLRADKRIVWFRVHALNHESIHNHDAFAEIAWTRPAQETGTPDNEAQ
jgi:GTP cyclohydrolase I